ncbi:MAG: SDR family NAD(P)-dependent oxidoreductase [Waddliaceae bacterium]
MDKKIAVVTGGSRGIGKAIATAFHIEGFQVAITGRDQKSLDEAKRSIGTQCHAFVCDQSSAGSIKEMTDSVLNKLGTPDILVNNAGIMMRHKPMLEISYEEWDLMIQTNLTGVFLTTQTFLPHMIKKNGGDIVMIASMSGKKGDKGHTAYAASKFGLRGFSEALLYEVRNHNIRVMVLNPSQVNTTDDESRPFIHTTDIAKTLIHLSKLPNRMLIKEMDLWGTNPTA